MPVKKIYRKIEDILKWLDNSKLWIIGLIIATVVFAPYIYMGESSVFPWHDQLDENILHYVLTARHLGENINRIPEMMSGVNVSAITPYGVFFVLLYAVFTPFVAFVIQYLIVFVIAFGGMYALIKYQTDSSIIAFMCAGLYSLLPFFPVYGSSVAAIPMMLFAVILLEKKENMVVAYVLIAIYVTTSSLFFTGYSILFFWCIIKLFAK